MLISVIIPSLNEHSNLESLIPYLLTIQEIHEIIVVEAGSTIQHFKYDDPKVKIVNVCVSSRAVQMNKGAALSCGDIFVFLHADVVPQKDSFQAIFQKYYNGFVFGFFSYEFHPDSFLLRINASFTKKKGWFSGGGDQMMWVTKDVFTHLNGFDETMVIMEDFDFSKKIKQGNLPFCVIDLPLKVSSRKYKNNSYFRVNFTNLIAFIMFSLGVAPVKIKRWCSFMLK